MEEVERVERERVLKREKGEKEFFFRFRFFFFFPVSSLRAPPSTRGLFSPFSSKKNFSLLVSFSHMKKTNKLHRKRTQKGKEVQSFFLFSIYSSPLFPDKKKNLDLFFFQQQKPISLSTF